MPKKFKTRVEGLPERVRSARRRAGLTQEALAKYLELPVATVRGWEYGRCEPCLYDLVQLAEALNVRSDYLLGL